MGMAAMAAIRISGPNSHKIIQKISNLRENDLVANTFKLAWIQEDDLKIDQALVLCFKAPRSFTGEDVIEIQCHGGTWLSKRVLDLILENGARLALPGEFTERAILNKKIDLSQAEGILDLIHSRGELSSTNALKLYSGKLGKHIQELRNKLLGILAELIACIDFPDEVTEYPQDIFTKQLTEIITEIQELLKSEKSGLILREGFKVALAGVPNAGKSSLLNSLLDSDRAIVTEIEGTTRDIIEESINLNGLTIVFLDTAGIRESQDTVEKIGIELSKKALKEADLVLWLEDINKNRILHTSSSVFQQILNDLILDGINPEKILRVGTKLDLALNSELNENEYDLCISTSKKINLDQLKELILKAANPELKKIHDANAVSINTRQADLLRQCVSELEKAIKAAKDALSHDFWTIDLKAAISRLGEITGDDLNEEILDSMFSQFCIGK